MERVVLINVYIVLTLLFTSSSAILYNNGWSFPDVQAERLIRELNLEVNVDEGYEFPSLAGAGNRLFEKKFKFPNLVEVSADGVSVEDLGHHAGYYKLAHTHDARMFYFFFESRNSKKDPVVIWLSGGPGCSSSLALFYENGPFRLANNLSLVWNEHGWDKASNLLYVDQPTGTGFSYSSDIQ